MTELRKLEVDPALISWIEAFLTDRQQAVRIGDRNPSQLKNEDLKFWLKCRGDTAKGLKTKAELVKRVLEYIKSGKDKNIIDPDPNNLYSKRKQLRSANNTGSQSTAKRHVPVKFPESIDLFHEDDQNPTAACTSELQKWHKKGGGSNIMPEPIMNVVVSKTKLEDIENPKRDGITSRLYESRVNVICDLEREAQMKQNLNGLPPGMGFSQMSFDTTICTTKLVESKYGHFPVGSPLSYQLSFTESNFKSNLDVSSMPRETTEGNIHYVYPRFPLVYHVTKMSTPHNLNEDEESLIDFLDVDENVISHLEKLTMKQSSCVEWQNHRKYRFTASTFDMIRKRKRNHNTFAINIMHPPVLNNKYIKHGKKFEPVALMEYQSLMRAKRMPITVIPSGLVISESYPILGASPDGR
ncbi:hypothetical protein AWC38_SpisGene320 [Stylophora pistillata]|uniref:YqaJ viral recombinase domain-containing protein n=1 Tax=Stylophora pistillata TaxID=50429 RepID=A0A2B4T1Z7_STYPI|nr:hypothetical protein AWC38_SpisGene320 [Stylophora pistillata]